VKLGTGGKPGIGLLPNDRSVLVVAGDLGNHLVVVHLAPTFDDKLNIWKSEEFPGNLVSGLHGGD
jgi:hypothetical protein